jgi:hypothetical protein
MFTPRRAFDHSHCSGPFFRLNPIYEVLEATETGKFEELTGDRYNSL